MDVFVGPIHFGNVNQAFNAFFDFNEAAVVGQVGHATSQFGTFWITLSDSYPWIFAQLFQAEGNTGTLAVDRLLENLQEGMEVKGIVKNLTDYGEFVDLGGVDPSLCR